MQQRTVKWFDAEKPAKAKKVRSRPAPQLKLLLEVEPAHRIFLHNLAETFSRRPPPPALPAARLGRFWGDVFITTRVPWWSFLESMLWHSLVIAILCLAPIWMPKERVRQTSPFRNSSITYYSPSKSFSAAKSSGPRARARTKKSTQAAHQRAAVVPREHGGIVTPPDLRQILAAARPNLGMQHAALPAVPLSAVPHSLSVPAGPTAVVAPAPSLNQMMTGRGGAQASVVGPPPDVAAVAGRRGTGGPGTGVVAPPPNLPAGVRRGGEVNLGHSAVVGPAPRLPMETQSAGSRMAYGTPGNGGGASVVPPPPSIEGTGIPNGRGSANSLSSSGLKVVPPAPSVEREGFGTRGDARLPGTGLKVVPPAPSIETTGGLRGRSTSLGSAGLRVVPPAPSVEGNGTFGGRGSSLSGSGSRVVPPPPSVEGAGGAGGTGRGGSLSSGGSQVVPPPPSVEGVGSGTGSGRTGPSAGAGSQAALPPQLLPGEEAGYGTAAERPRPAKLPPEPGTSPSAVIDRAAAEEVPLRLIGLHLALPTSSYFSNYEVFIAERRLGKTATQLIKLVYIYLPYQRRLSDYVQSDSRVYKLRVTRDPTCDENMLQMMQPQSDQPHVDQQAAAIPPELSALDPTSVLPCYRTTADDYRNALSKTR